MTLGLGDVLAIYAAAVSSTLAVLRVVEFRSSRRRVHLRIANSLLYSANPARPKPTSVLAIHIGNRAPFPLHISSVGLMLKNGKGLYFMQIAELPAIQQKLEPTAGTMLGIYPHKLAEAIKTADEVKSVYCNVGSGETYERKISRAERKEITDALADAAKK